MSLRTILGRMMLCLCGLSVLSSAYAERLITATPLLQGGGIIVDVFDDPAASSDKPSSTTTVPFKTTYTVPVVQSFKGQVYMFWTSKDDQKKIFYSTSVEGKNWSAPKFIPVGSILTDVSATVFKQKLVLTFADAQGRLNTISSLDGTGWPPAVSLVPTVHRAANNKPVVYNGQLFVLYNENSGKAAYYVTYDGLKWSSEKTAFQESPDTIVNLVPVVYNGALRVYYTFFNGGLFERTYDRGGSWGEKQRLRGIPGSSLNSAVMVNERLFISSGPNIFYTTGSTGPTGSINGLEWAPYFAYSGRSAFPSGLGVSYAITTSDLTGDNPQLPADLATGLSHTDYATFAWRSFFALNNTAMTPLPAKRGVGNPGSSFADSGKASQSPTPLLWQTFAHRSELFPAVGFNPVGGPTRSYGSEPQYTYTQFLQKKIRMAPSTDFTLYNNLDEATQIGQNAIFFPVKPPDAAKTTDARGVYAPSNDSQILFEAKANPVVYNYAKGLTRYPDHIVLPDGAVEVKAAWRKLADIPVADRGRYHTATVVTYKGLDSDPEAQNEDYALVALHIIHKTANYPTFIFATFEHEDALTLPDGKSPTGLYYIANYNKIAYPGFIPSPTAPSPSATFSDGGSEPHKVFLPEEGPVANAKLDPPVYSGSNGIPEGQAGPIKVVQPLTIHSEVKAVNDQVKQLMDGSSEFNNSVWKHYRLKGVQAIPSSTSTDPDYYLANIMVESSQPGIQLFQGSNVFPIGDNNTLINARNQPNIKVPDYDHSTQSLTMGGCMGCHGIAQSSLKQGFSFLFDAINPTFAKGVTGFAGPETVGLPDPRTSKARALKYSFGPQNTAAVEEASK
ncbi:exo-alpha-sialidase [Pseudomonas sp. OA65]|uniref:exo-alpha-sialidase n=1 Tax=Pseudomonas sp. OA65 TaxID=2818431 RepID=UPI001A9D1479|nr:exo-alpha-sialidase [Pseudomonas sp. OA65]MBO1540984.1 exo-alpha-sialidase [Pseudomonas sp. OA65]